MFFCGFPSSAAGIYLKQFLWPEMTSQPTEPSSAQTNVILIMFFFFHFLFLSLTNFLFPFFIFFNYSLASKSSSSKNYAFFVIFFNFDTLSPSLTLSLSLSLFDLSRFLSLSITNHNLIEQTYRVPQKLPQIYTAIAYICSGKVA